MIEPAPPRRALSLAAIALSRARLARCSTRPNPAFCCSDPADCARFGISDEERACADGFACVGNTCVRSSCETDGCTAAAPVCDAVADVCVGCTDPADCAGFPDSQVCDVATGACVACVDSACPSGACAEDGTCAAEESVVYLHPDGQDAVPCSRAQPCKDLQFGVQQTTSARNHIVLAPGSYTLPASPHQLTAQVTTAPRLTIHGGGATLTGGSGDGFIIVGLPVTLRDLEIVNPTPSEGIAIGISATTVLERMKIRGYIGIATSAQTRLVDVDVRATNLGIRNSGSLTIDRATISGGAIGIVSTSGSVDITNVLVSGTSGIGLDFTSTSGSVAFSTITDTGNGGTGTPGMRCQGLFFSVRSTIVWTPASPLRAGIEGGCNLQSSIVGPIGVVGAMSSDPVFVNPAAGDFHLSGGSPARDLVDTGPATDFEGEPRPRGARFDIGADETP